MKKNCIWRIAYIIIFALIVGAVNLSLHDSAIARMEMEMDGSASVSDAAVCSQYDGADYDKDDYMMNKCLEKLCVKAESRNGGWAAAGGGMAGAATGAATGAAIGSVIPGVGTLVGGVAGGLFGGFMGVVAGEATENSFHPTMNCNEAKKQLAKEKKDAVVKQKKTEKKDADDCTKFDGKTYDDKNPDMKKCNDGGTTYCNVVNGKMDCSKAKATSASAATAISSTSGTPGTKNPSRAEGSLTGGGIGSGPVGDFLGFPAWNRDVNFEPGNEIGPQVMKIVLNITEILLRLAGIAAVIVIIYAGAMFIIGSYSSSPDGIAKAKTILINGVIGLVVAIAATAIVSFIAGSLKGK